MNTISQIALPDFEIVGIKEIHACLRKFGLNDDEFTLAPAIGGILVYDIKAGFIWFPNIVIKESLFRLGMI